MPQIKKSSAGFTLIELLVVIAIVGILASIALASLGESKIKGNDAAVKSNLNSLRTQMELYYAKNGNYGTTPYSANSCPTNPAYTHAIFSTYPNEGDPIVFSALQEAIKNGEPDPVNSNGTWNALDRCIVLGAPTSKWAVAVTLKGNTKSWCVDSLGTSKLYQVPASSAVNAGVGKCN